MNDRIQKLIEQATSTQGPTPYNPLTFEVFDKEKFAELLFDEFCDVVIDCDENPKLILHEPYRTIIAKLCDHFNGEKNERTN